MMPLLIHSNDTVDLEVIIGILKSTLKPSPHWDSLNRFMLRLCVQAA